MIWFQRHVLYIRFDATSLTIRSSQRTGVYTDRPLLAVEGSNRIVAVGAAALQAVAEDSSSYRLVAPFSHPRLWISNYSAAEALIRYGMAVLKLPYPRLRPHVIVHPCRLIADDLTHIELMAGFDLALNLQAKHAYVWIGRELSEQEQARLQFPASEGRVFKHPSLVDTLDTIV